MQGQAKTVENRSFSLYHATFAKGCVIFSKFPSEGQISNTFLTRQRKLAKWLGFFLLNRELLFYMVVKVANLLIKFDIR
jgi:hypothetical protein